MCNRPEQVLLSWTCVIADKVESHPQWDWVSGLSQLDGHIWELAVSWEPAIVSSVLRVSVWHTTIKVVLCKLLMWLPGVKLIIYRVERQLQMSLLQYQNTFHGLLWLISARNCTQSCLMLYSADLYTCVLLSDSRRHSFVSYELSCFPKLDRVAGCQPLLEMT